ncbi:hypothetical protein DPEC_G00192580 [Dallia pectoralis]|uniref:Uncharacterized protein n=1 Tax=Dallia pectoralis TaxID=75939 RepID=A0ACC2GCR9_DALPE|nr:hypothetical protein DPEC_G00192580 [Dallia pectoralis]
MEYLCVVVLLFSAVTAQPGPPRQWQQQFGNPQGNPNGRPMRPNSRDPSIDGFLPPFAGQPSGAGGINFRPIGEGPMVPRWPVGGAGNTQWPTQDQMPPGNPNRPSGDPGNSGTQGPMGGPFRGNPQSGVPPWSQGFGGPPNNPGQGNEMGPGFGFSNNGAGPYPRPYPGVYPGPKAPPRSNNRQAKAAGTPRRRPNRPVTWPNRKPIMSSSGSNGSQSFDDNPFGGRPLDPEMVENREFIPIFQADNVTIQNVSGLTLKEGENIFLLPRAGRRPPPKQNERNGPQDYRFGYPSYNSFQPYMNIIFNPTATPKYSFQYGITTLLPSFMKAEETDPEEEKEE